MEMALLTMMFEAARRFRLPAQEKTAAGGLAVSWRPVAQRHSRPIAKNPPSAAANGVSNANINPLGTHAMLRTRFAKPAIVGAMIGLALLAAGTANAGTSDDQFFGALQQQGIGFGTPDSAITVAHHVCDALGQGMTPSDISGNIAGANAGIDRQTAVVIVVDAAQAYCPQFVHQMSNGATVVGPNR
jgi:hypothetical protein